MTQVPMTQGQDQFFPNIRKKKLTIGHISNATSFTDFILGTKVQPNKSHFMTQVVKTLNEGQGEIFIKFGKKNLQLTISMMLIHPL